MRTLDVPAGELRLAAVEAAQAVTDLVLTGFRECTEVRLKRDSHDIVTEFDLLAEQAIHSRLRDLVPGSGFVGEETGRHDEDRAIAWHVDPIDGTTNFASGMPAWSVSIGAVVADEVIAGVVWDPVRGEMFSADDTGAYLNDQPVRARAAEDSATGVLLTCYPDVLDLDLDGSALAYSRHEGFQRAFRAVRGLGSSALQLAWVAAGRVAATITTHQQSWDVAAGCCLVTRAGGSVVGLTADHRVAQGAAFRQPTVMAHGSPAPYPFLLDLWTSLEGERG